MNLGDPLLIAMGLALAVPIAVLAVLNWLFRARGGIARGWAGVIFILMCLVTFFTVVALRLQ